jgi:hypothetical protein
MSIYQYRNFEQNPIGFRTQIEARKGGLQFGTYKTPGYNPEAKTYEIHVPGANYEGPGSWISNRWVKLALPGTTRTDEAARKHDIQYSNLGALRIRDKISESQLVKGIQNSDKQLIKTARENLLSKNPMEAMHAAIASAGIYGKMKLQNMGLIDKAAFTKVDDTTPYIDENSPKFLADLPAGYLGTGHSGPLCGAESRQTRIKHKKVDRLWKLRKQLKVV